jgi:putative spermidine/putrescine transport system permease protein
MRDRSKTSIILPLAPVILLISLFFIIPLLTSLFKSVHSYDGKLIGLDSYATVLSDPSFIGSLAYTVELAVASTVIAIVAAVVISMAIRGTFIGKKLCLFLYQMNASIPHLSVAAMMLFLLGSTGLVSSIFMQIGAIGSYSDFPDIVNGYSPQGAIISFAWKFAPFIGLSVLSVLQSALPDYEDQAATLGVGPYGRLIHVTLPAIKPAIISSSMICFAYAFGSYEVPALLGRQQTLAMKAYDIFTQPYGATIIDQSYVICNIISLVTLTTAIAYLYYSIPRTKRRGP